MKRFYSTHKNTFRYHVIDDWFPPTTARHAKSITQNKAEGADHRTQKSSGDIEETANDEVARNITQSNSLDSNRGPSKNGPSLGTPEDYGSETDIKMEDFLDGEEVCSSDKLCEKNSHYTPLVQLQTSSMKILPFEKGRKVRPAATSSAPQTNKRIHLPSPQGDEASDSKTDTNTPESDLNENYRLVGHFTSKAIKGTDANIVANNTTGKTQKTGADHERFVPTIISENANGEELTKYLDRLGSSHEFSETHTGHGSGTATCGAQSLAEPEKSSSSRLSLDDARQTSSESGSKYLVSLTNGKGHFNSKDRYDGTDLPTSNDRNTSRTAVENKQLVPQESKFQLGLTSGVSENSSCKREGQMLEKQRTSKTCDVCGKYFLRQYDLKRHYLSHSSERRFICKECNKTFKKRDLWCSHWQPHTNDRDFLTQVCGTYGPFISTGEPESLEKSQKKMKSCKICNFPLAPWRDKNHAETVDLIYEHFHCPVCLKIYRRESNCREHIVNNHMD